MNIRLINIMHDNSDIDNIRRLYARAFHPDEQAPFSMLLKKAKKPNVNFFSCRDNDEWIGLLYVVNHLDLSYIFYFAVDDTKRGKGCGTAILKAARKKYSKRRFFLGIEEVDEKYDNYRQRLERLHFYEHAGFKRTGQKMQEGKVILELMSTGGKVSNRDYRRLIRSFAGLRMLFFTMKIFEDK